EVEPPAEASIYRYLFRQRLSVAPDTRRDVGRISSGPVGWRGAAVAVTVQICSGQRCERPARCGTDDRRDLRGGRQLVQPRDDETVALIPHRRSLFQIRVETRRQAGGVCRISSRPIAF